jgi:hypothetical protein
MVAVLIRWWQSSLESYRIDLPTTEIRFGNLSISAPISDPSERSALVQTVMQGCLVLRSLDNHLDNPQSHPDAAQDCGDQPRGTSNSAQGIVKESQQELPRLETCLSVALPKTPSEVSNVSGIPAVKQDVISSESNS